MSKRDGVKRGAGHWTVRDRERRREEGKGKAVRESWHSAAFCHLIRC